MRSWKGSASSSASTNALGNSNSTELSTTRTHVKFPSTTLLPRLDLEGSEMDSDSFASRPLSPTTPGLGLSSTLHSLGQASQPLSSLPDRLDIASTRLMRLKTARMDMLKHRSDGRMDSPRSSMTMNQLTSSLPGTSRTDVGRTRFPRRSHQEPIGLSSTQARQASDPTPVKIHRPQRMLRTSSDQNWTYGHNPIADFHASSEDSSMACTSPEYVIRTPVQPHLHNPYGKPVDGAHRSRENRLSETIDGDLPTPSINLPAVSVVGSTSVSPSECALWSTEIILPDSKWKSGWDIASLLFMLFSVVAVPLQLGFYEMESADRDLFPVALFLTAADLLYIFDIVLNFRTAYVGRQGKLVTNGWVIARKYLEFWFWVDLVSIVPVQMLPRGLFPHQQLAYLLKAPRLLRLYKPAKKLSRSGRGAGTFGGHGLRIFSLLLAFLLVAHWVACTWFALGMSLLDECDECSWVDDQSISRDTSIAKGYITSMYWALATMTTVGYGDIVPRASAERWFTVAVFLVGSIMYSSIFANVSILLQNLDAVGFRYRSRLDEVNELLRFYCVPEGLAARVLTNVDGNFTVTGGFSPHQNLKHLPWCLRVEVCMNLYESVVRQAPMFQHVHKALIQEIVTRLFPSAYSPGEWIFHEGDVGHEMMFVGAGKLHILSGQNQDVVLQHVSKGAFLGETALFFSPSRRTASLRAVTCSLLYSITKQDFEEVLLDFPNELVEMIEIAEFQRQQNDLLKTSAVGAFDGWNQSSLARRTEERAERALDQPSDSNNPLNFSARYDEADALRIQSTKEHRADAPEAHSDSHSEAASDQTLELSTDKDDSMEQPEGHSARDVANARHQEYHFRRSLQREEEADVGTPESTSRTPLKRRNSMNYHHHAEPAPINLPKEQLAGSSGHNQRLHDTSSVLLSQVVGEMSVLKKAVSDLDSRTLEIMKLLKAVHANQQGV